MFYCLKKCLNGGFYTKTAANTAHHQRTPEIHLDPTYVGSEVVLLGNNLRITGTGGALGTAPLVQSKSYFEVKIQHDGTWSIGLASRKTDLQSIRGGEDAESWCLCSDNILRHNNEVKAKVLIPVKAEVKCDRNSSLLNGDLLANENLQDSPGNGNVIKFPGEGDIVGVVFDHIELNFFCNGRNLEIPCYNVKASALYPVIYAGNGAVLDIIFDNFHYSPPPGFERIILEQSLL